MTHKIISFIVIASFCFFFCLFYQATAVDQPVDLGSEKVTFRGFQVFV